MLTNTTFGIVPNSFHVRVYQMVPKNITFSSIEAILLGGWLSYSY
jgi:hypothetical protein